MSDFGVDLACDVEWDAVVEIGTVVFGGMYPKASWLACST